MYDISEKLLNDIVDNEPYTLTGNCNLYASPDNMVNIYVESNPITYEYAVRLIDAQPLEKRDLPLKFQYAIKNVEFYGECVG